MEATFGSVAWMVAAGRAGLNCCRKMPSLTRSRLAGGAKRSALDIGDVDMRRWTTRGSRRAV